MVQLSQCSHDNLALDRVTDRYRVAGKTATDHDNIEMMSYLVNKANKTHFFDLTIRSEEMFNLLKDKVYRDELHIGILRGGNYRLISDQISNMRLSLFKRDLRNIPLMAMKVLIDKFRASGENPFCKIKEEMDYSDMNDEPYLSVYMYDFLRRIGLDKPKISPMHLCEMLDYPEYIDMNLLPYAKEDLEWEE